MTVEQLRQLEQAAAVMCEQVTYEQHWPSSGKAQLTLSAQGFAAYIDLRAALSRLEEATDVD